MSAKKLVYYFGEGKAEGNGEMKELLGGKGANLAEMSLLGIPVPPGFTITTEVCNDYYRNGSRVPKDLYPAVSAALARVEKAMKRKFGNPADPLLVSVRSGARSSMPGMMETVLNVGLTSASIPGLIKRTGAPRFVWDSYRRLIMMYSDVVMEKAAGIVPKEGEGIRTKLDHILHEEKVRSGAKSDTDLNADQLEKLCATFKDVVKKTFGKPFPDDPMEQLKGAIEAVFRSWMGKKAVEYRRIEKIPDAWGTAVNVQSMVFGNLGDTSATGVAFTRNAGTGENEFQGEYLINAQGEDVVAGIRTPGPVLAKYEKKGEQQSLENWAPKAFKELMAIRMRLEKHFRDMLDIEFTVEDGVLYMLQCRVGKRNGTAAVRLAVEMLEERLIDKRTALMRVKPTQLNELLLPMVDPDAERKTKPIASGLPAGPGGATGEIVFTAEEAEAKAKRGKKVILVRTETSPEDVAGMHVSEAILTARGGVTSHAALVARGWGKCCIVGVAELDINPHAKTLKVGGATLREGDHITLNGSVGNVYAGKLNLIFPDINKNPWYKKLMAVADGFRQIGVRTNADSPADAQKARSFGAEGIGLCRTEHMFFGEKRIKAVREMIVAQDHAGRAKAIGKLLPFQRQDFFEIFKAMDGLPVTVRLLDPPLHEFTPQEPNQIVELSHELGITKEELTARIKELHEANPMLGHRGCRLGITYPEITAMQARAIFEAAADCIAAGTKVFPEIMVPLVGTVKELENQAAIIRATGEAVMAEKKVKVKYLLGTMIELPRACLTADQIAEAAEFFSFGTNDLTQTTFGFSRDDIGTFLPDYLDKKILAEDPFISLDQNGVGQLVKMGIAKGRSVRAGLKVGICGEHGGDPASVEFCHRVGMNYVSCSPFRVPIALFAAAQAAAKTQQEAVPMAAAKKAAAKKAAPKKAAAKKAAPKKAAAKKPAAKKAAPKKAAAKKAAPKKAAAKKPAAKKPAAKKAAAKKPAAKKAAPKKAKAPAAPAAPAAGENKA